MDDRAVFDQFHEALELEPRPGAYERFRADFMRPAVAAKRRPVFRLRFSKMSLRIAAAVAVVAIAAALVAGVLATHHAQTGIPAGQDQNTRNYIALMARDYAAMNASTSNHCQIITDSGCAAAIATVNATLQKWIDDLAAYKNTPMQFVPLDSLIRSHLRAVIVEQVAAIGLQKAHNDALFTFAMNSAFYERSWVDPATFAIEGSYVRTAGSYRDAVRVANQSLSACVNGIPGPSDLACNRLINGATCAGSGINACESYVEQSLTQIESFLVAIVQNPPSAALSKGTRQFESDLVKADNDLLAITEAIVAGDATKADQAEFAFSADINLAQTDVGLLIS